MINNNLLQRWRKLFCSKLKNDTVIAIVIAIAVWAENPEVMFPWHQTNSYVFSKLKSLTS